MKSTARTGILVYDFATKKFESLVEGFAAEPPQWLKDSRRLLFVRGRTIYLLDSVSRKVSELFTTDSTAISLGSISSDNRQLFVSDFNTAADIWMITLK